MNLHHKLLSLIPILLIIIFWHLVVFSGLVNSFLLPPPKDVFLKIVELIVTWTIIFDIIATLIRTGLGFIGGIVIGVPLGVVMGYYKKIYALFEFLVDFLRSLPATALFPLFLLFFGIGDEAKIAMTIFMSSLIILVNTMYGVKNRNKTREMIAKTMKIEGFQLFRKVTINEAKPYLFAGLRVSISLSFIVVIVAEMFIGSSVGLGYKIFNALIVYKISEMYSVIILTGLVGYLINRLIVYTERRQIPWMGF